VAIEQGPSVNEYTKRSGVAQSVMSPPLIEKWQRLMRIRVKRFFVQRMKTKWGSCNDRGGSSS
jgi:predicted metal-dependent hydrolase